MHEGVHSDVSCPSKQCKFDMIEWSYLFVALEKYGFGPALYNWIKVLAPMAAVRHN